NPLPQGEGKKDTPSLFPSPQGGGTAFSEGVNRSSKAGQWAGPSRRGYSWGYRVLESPKNPLFFRIAARKCGCPPPTNRIQQSMKSRTPRRGLRLFSCTHPAPSVDCRQNVEVSEKCWGHRHGILGPA